MGRGQPALGAGSSDLAEFVEPLLLPGGGPYEAVGEPFLFE
jgi:hypothetical protein